MSSNIEHTRVETDVLGAPYRNKYARGEEENSLGRPPDDLSGEASMTGDAQSHQEH